MKGKRTKKRGPKVIRIFPDSSWLISYLNPKDIHHNHVESCHGMLAPFKPTFYFSTLVVMETMSGLIKNGFTSKKAYDCLLKFVNELDDYRLESPIKLGEVFKTYFRFAKARKINKLTTVDFYIATAAMTVRAKLLTSDKRMYKTTKASYAEAYLIADKVKGMKSDLPRLTDHIVNNIKV